MGIIVLALVALVLPSCKKEDKIPNQFTIDGSVKFLNSAVFFSNQTPSVDPADPFDSELYYHHVLTLLSEGFTLNGNVINGTGNALDLEINSPSINLEPGIYNFTSLSQNAKAFDFEEGRAFLNFSTQNSTGEILEFTPGESGKVIVSKSGNTYTVDVEGIADGKIIKGHYSGALTIRSL